MNSNVIRSWERFAGIAMRTALGVVLLCGAANTASGQERTGTIKGSVADASGAVLAGAQITLKNKVTLRTFETVSGPDGTYIARNLEPGHYSIRFESKGFGAYQVGDVNLLLGQTLDVNVTMSVARTEQSLQVTDEAPLIDTTNATRANNITAEEFDRLPKARSFQSLALNSTSVNTGEIEGGVQVNGASGSENQFNVDGISTTSLLNGQSRQDAVFEILQEVQVKTGGISAEFGGALGGVISAISKSGGNAFHGDVHYYLSGNKLSAAPRQRLLLSPSDDTTTSYYQDKKQKDNRNEIGYSLGGYMKKDRLYFFSAASPRWTRRSNDYNFSNGTTTGSIEQKSITQMFFNKLSFDITKTLRGSAHWLYSPTISTGSLPGYNGECPNCLTSSLASNAVRKDIGYASPQQNYGAQLDWVASPTMLISVRGGRFWDNFKEHGFPQVTPVTYQTSATSLPFTVPSQYRQPIGFFNTPRLSQSFYDAVARTYVQADFSKFLNFGGTHDIKAGIGRQKNVNRVFLGYPTGGYINVFWDRSFRSNATGVTDRGTYGYYEFHEFGTQGTTGASLDNIYLQDNWRIHKRLTLNLGIRFERERVPSFQRDVKDFAFDFGWGQKIAPRLGASYDLFGNGKARLYGSWGRYFDWVKYELARGTFGGDYWRVQYRSLDTPDVFSLNSGNLPGRNLWNNTAGSFRNRRVPGFETIDPDIKPMASDNFNAGGEFTLSNQMVLRVGYVHNNLIRTIEDLGVLVNGNEEYFYANPGSGIASITPPSGGSQPFKTPKARRTYDAMEIALTKRIGSWFGSASYVLSRLYGNYAGLASTDEVRTGSDGVGVYAINQQTSGIIARPGGNANRAWDIDELLWDSKGNLDLLGRLPTDRPHVLKLYGSRSFKWSGRMATDLGAFFYAGSGTPLTSEVYTINQTRVFVNGRGDLGRTPVLSTTGLVVGHEFTFKEGHRLRFEFNAENLFNQKTSRHSATSINRARQSAGIDLSNVDLAKGYDYNALIRASSEGAKALNPLLGQADLFNPGFSGRFLVKYIF